MDAVRDLLLQKAAENPESSQLTSALAVLDELAHTRQLGEPDSAAHKLVSLFAELQEQGLWGTNSEEKGLMKALEAELSSRTKPKPKPVRGFTIVAPPPASRTRAGVPWTTDSGHALLVDATLHAHLNEVAFLHVLATAPAKVVPTGKSLRAVLAGPEAARALGAGRDDADHAASHAPPTLQAKVEEIAQRAFWDEALESLASPVPGRQLARLKRLYADLHTALGALLPPTHHSMVTLSTPLSPTPAPLVSAVRHLKELTAALKTRCAPVRDPDLDAILAILDRTSPAPSDSDSDPGSSSAAPAPSSLPARIIGAIKSLLHIADVMKSDLASAALSVVNDDELTAEIVRVARERERHAVISMYGIQGVCDRWRKWVATAASFPSSTEEPDARWVRQLVNALGADVAVSCPLPDPNSSPPCNPAKGDATEGNLEDQPSLSTYAVKDNSNALPPPFLFSSDDLLHLQNHLQALVIAAVLCTLVPLPSHSNPATSSFATQSSRSQGEQSTVDSEERTFTERVLSLLMIEVDETSQDSGTTKLIHLADEVVREHRRLSLQADISSPTTSTPPSTRPPDEKALRSAVDALVQSTNGVFVLLRRRILSALADNLVAALHAEQRAQDTRVPDTMQAGRDRKRLRLAPLVPQPQRHGGLRRVVEERTVLVRGFDDPVLRRGVGEALGEVADVVEWVRETWAGTLGLGGLDSGAGDSSRAD